MPLARVAGLGSRLMLDYGDRPVAVVLAGGRSRRFGRDKAFIRVGKEFLITNLCDKLSQANFEIVLSGPQQRLSFFGYPVISDQQPQAGPLPAVSSVWKQLCCERLLLLACDMPFISLPMIEALWRASRDCDIVLPLKNVRPSPLPGVYSSRTAPICHDLVRRHRHDLKALLEVGLRVTYLEARELDRVDPNRESLWNINTQDDLKEYESISR